MSSSASPFVTLTNCCRRERRGRSQSDPPVLAHLSQQQLTIFVEKKEEGEKKKHDDSGFAFRNALSAADPNIRVQADSTKEGRWWDYSPF